MHIVMDNKDTADSQLQDLRNKFHTAVAAWKVFADTAGKAYANAYKQQGRILKHIHDQLVADRDAEAKILTFALSLVTVGIAGGVAGSLAGKIATGMEKAAAEEFIKWAKDKAKGVVKTATAASVKYLHPEKLAPDAFEPAAEDPLSYFLEMYLRIDTRDRNVAELADSLSGSNVSLGVVRELEELVLDTSFVTQAPDDVDEGVLYRSASLGLWIAWAYQRDEEYWAARSDDLNWEAMEFDPLRIELVTLGVPANVITLRSKGKTTFTKQMGMFLNGKTGLNMNGFVDWATSVHAAVEMLRGMPKNEFTAMAQKEMIQKSCNRFVGV
ncbi:MAG: hypothetical protein ACLQLC_07290 [Candidatus Sulfotelmatobacter sp.]